MNIYFTTYNYGSTIISALQKTFFSHPYIMAPFLNLPILNFQNSAFKDTNIFWNEIHINKVNQIFARLLKRFF